MGIWRERQELRASFKKCMKILKVWGFPSTSRFKTSPHYSVIDVVNNCPDSMSLHLHYLFTIAIVAMLVEIDNDIVVYLIGLTFDEFEASVFLSL